MISKATGRMCAHRQGLSLETPDRQTSLNHNYTSIQLILDEMAQPQIISIRYHCMEAGKILAMMELPFYLIFLIIAINENCEENST